MLAIESYKVVNLATSIWGKLDFDYDMSILIKGWYCVAWKKVGLSYKNGVVVENGWATLGVFFLFGLVLKHDSSALSYTDVCK